MAKKTRKGSLASKLGTAGKRAVSVHKTDETTFDTGGDLPAGIEGGIAQLVDCKFDIFKKDYNRGEYFFLAAGIVKQPTEHDGMPIEGLRTQIGPEPMCDTSDRTRKDVDAHIEWVFNEMRKLGMDTSELDIDSLEDAAAALKEEQPHFRFRTWKGEKQTEGRYKDMEPRVNHVWKGVCEFEEAEGDEVVDDTDEIDGIEREVSDEDLVALGKAADGGDEEAESSLSEKAEELGIDPNEYTTWAEVATVIEEAPETDDDIEKEAETEEDDDTDEGEEEEEEEVVPEKEGIYFYKPPRAKKRLECEVTAVYPRKRVCNLKSLDDEKVFKSVAFGKLEE